MSLINRRQSVRYPQLSVLKYDRKVFYKGLWNTDADLLEARGHVEDADGNVVIRPFTKIFNRFENNTDIARDEMCVAVKKINGFMAAATYVPAVGEVVVSTTGSLDSDFVRMAEQHITHSQREAIKDWSQVRGPHTFLFEIVDKADPHIIVEDQGAYLIGLRSVASDKPYFSDQVNECHLDDLAMQYGFDRPGWYYAPFWDVVWRAQEAEHEGFVVYGQESRTALKIKSPYYLTLKLIARKADILSLDKTRVDEEYYPLLNHISSIGDSFNKLDEQQRLDYMRSWLVAHNDENNTS